MPLTYFEQLPDSFHAIFQQAQTIKCLMKESIACIESRRNKQVIVGHQYILEPNAKRIKTDDSRKMVTKTGYDDLLAAEHVVTTKKINHAIESWRYSGKPLKKETIAFGDFINLRMETFSDLERLYMEYSELLDKYSVTLRDHPESYKAVWNLILNMELLQMAVGKIYMKILHVEDAVKRTNIMKKSEDEETRIESNLIHKSQVEHKEDPYEQGEDEDEPQEDEQGEEEDEPKAEDECFRPYFENCSALSLQGRYFGHDAAVSALESFNLNGTQYMASASSDHTVKLWNLEKNEIDTILTGHGAGVTSLVSFKLNGLPMLATGSVDKTIKIWNLLNNKVVRTLWGHSGWISSLLTYKMNGKNLLASAGFDNTIKIWDLDNYSLIETLYLHNRYITAMSIFMKEDKPYLISGGLDKNIHIWCLREHQCIASIRKNPSGIESLLVLDHNGEKILVSGFSNGCISVFALKNNRCIASFKAHHSNVTALEVIRSDNKVYLLSASWDKAMRIWNLDDHRIVATLKSEARMDTVKILMRGDRACLVSGDDNGNIQLWD